MHTRCTDPKIRLWPRYGGRGIKVVYRSFEEFLADIGQRPGAGYSVDRIDNDGHYAIGNCRWSTKPEQGRNQSSNVELTWDGETKSLTEWAESIGLKVNTLQYRIKRGWTVERALTTETLR